MSKGVIWSENQASSQGMKMSKHKQAKKNPRLWICSSEKILTTAAMNNGLDHFMEIK